MTCRNVSKYNPLILLSPVRVLFGDFPKPYANEKLNWKEELKAFENIQINYYHEQYFAKNNF